MMKAQTTRGVRWKIRTPHRKTEELPFHAWHWTGEPLKADKLGRRNERMYEAQWARVTCLYEDCPAEALIRIWDMVSLLPVPEVRPRQNKDRVDLTQGGFDGTTEPAEEARRREVQVGEAAPVHVGGASAGSEEVGAQPQDDEGGLGEVPAEEGDEAEAQVDPAPVTDWPDLPYSTSQVFQAPDPAGPSEAT